MTSASCASWKGSVPSRSCKHAPHFSSLVPRPSSPVPRPSSLRTRAAGVAIRIPVQTPVPRPRNPRGISRGPQPRPYSPEYGAAPVGRCLKIPAKRPSQIETNRFDLKRRSRGNLAGIRPKAGYRPFTRATTRFPLAHFFRFFLWASKERSPPEATGQETKSQRRAANPQKPGGLPAAAGTGTGRRFFRSCRSDLLSQRGERRQRRAQGNLFRGGSLGNPSPTTKGAPPPLDSPLLDERRGFTGDDGRCPLPRHCETSPQAGCGNLSPLPPRPRTMPASRLPCPARASRPGALFLFPPPKISPRRIVIFARLLYNSILG